jgi:hypothetical protein
MHAIDNSDGLGLVSPERLQYANSVISTAYRFIPVHNERLGAIVAGVSIMTRCAVCDYFYIPATQTHTVSGGICLICEARTTSEARRALLIGMRVPLSYMDSD